MKIQTVPTKLLCVLFCLLSFLSTMAERRLPLSSPSARLQLSLPDQSSDHSFLLSDTQTVLAEIGMGMHWANSSATAVTPSCFHVKALCSSAEYKEYLLIGKESAFQVRLRLFDDALAFRYEGQNDNPVRLLSEQSSWTLSPDAQIWYFERPNAWKLKSYAGTWTPSLLSDMSRRVSSPVQGTPVVFQLPNGKYGFISEAALADYSGLRLKLSGNTFSADFTEGAAGFDVSGHFCSPWRIIFIGDDLNALVNQQVIRRLQPQPEAGLFADRSYIRPGKSVWRWFSHGTGNPSQEREMIDAAARLHFAYTTIDDGWKNWTDKWTQVKELSVYARPKGVRIFLWFNSKPLQRPDNDYESLRLMLDSVAQSGAAGVKVDFMDSEAKRLIDFEQKLLRECARRSLLVNFHGCQKSTGENYSFPNEVTREGIRGLELNKMREGYITAAHNAALPFTRFVVGHADYTPLSFTVPGATTFAHQLATLVCFDSFMQTLGESPQMLLNEPLLQPALPFIREVPTVWDEVRVLSPSEIGKLAILAKRSGDDWYIGILNGEQHEKQIRLDLNPFVQGNATVDAYLDDLEVDKVLLSMKGHRPGAMKREPSVPFKKEISTTTLPQLRLAPNGGAVLVIHNK